MKRRKKYEPTHVDVVLQEERRSTWKWNSRTIRGTEMVFDVLDRNFDRLNKWTFSVKVPKNVGQIVVQPQTVPGKKRFSSLERRSIIFIRATKNPHRKQLYCKANLADPTGSKTKLTTKLGDRARLPKWFKYFNPDMRLKHTVTTTAANDGEHQVILVDRGDYPRMIRLFFALRVWILQEKIVIH